MIIIKLFTSWNWTNQLKIKTWVNVVNMMKLRCLCIQLHALLKLLLCLVLTKQRPFLIQNIFKWIHGRTFRNIYFAFSDSLSLHGWWNLSKLQCIQFVFLLRWFRENSVFVEKTSWFPFLIYSAAFSWAWVVQFCLKQL